MQGLGGHLRRSFVAPLFIIAQKHDTTDGLAIHRRIEMPDLLLLSGRRPSPFLEVDTSPSQSLNTVASLSLGQFLSRRLLLPSSPQDLQNGRALKLEGLHCITWFKNALSATHLPFSSHGNQSSQGAEMRINLLIKTSERSPSGPSPRHWTNVLLASNLLVYVAQLATRGRLMQWGAKINTKIYQGQLWRLVTSSFLHVNIWHLLVNCYSLDSIGPFVETLSGPKRFIAIYFTSAVASSAMSYWFSKASSVGASGAIAGLVGAAAVFAMQHRGEYEGATKDLENIAIVIALNMLIGLAWKRIDNWGHLGGLLGGSAVTWLLSFAWN